MIYPFLAKVLEVVVRVATAFALVRYRMKKQKTNDLEDENEILKDTIGHSDVYLADKLRERARLKQDRNKR